MRWNSFLLSGYLTLTLLPPDVLIEQTYEDWLFENREQEFVELFGNQAYEEFKMGKTTDINPHLQHNGDTGSILEKK